jgi:hypothetical protein
MILDSGTIKLCTAADDNDGGGLMPSEKLTVVSEQYFGEQTIGITRAYLSKGADEQIDMVVRIQDEGVRPQIGMVAVVDMDNDERQYQITLVQPKTDEDGLRVYDITLRRVNRNYDIEG